MDWKRAACGPLETRTSNIERRTLPRFAVLCQLGLLQVAKLANARSAFNVEPKRRLLRTVLSPLHCLPMEIAISVFKEKCIHLLKSTAETGDELVVTLRGRPLARIVGVPSAHKRVLGGQPDVLAAGVSEDALIDSDFENDWEP